MQLSTSLTLLAMAAGALSQGLQITDSIGASVLQVLATAIPPESISQATADPAAFSSELDSSIRAGNTPSWYQALPSDVKSYLPQLYPAETPASTTAESTPAATSEAASTSAEEPTTPAPPVSGTSAPTGGNTTIVVSSPTLGSTGGANSDAPTSTSSEAGAAMHTGMVGAGLVGAMGFLLAL